jgi:hypothetical protein
LVIQTDTATDGQDGSNTAVVTISVNAAGSSGGTGGGGNSCLADYLR